MSQVTLKQIAKLARVSEMTVSTVLNGRSSPRQSKAIARAKHIRSIAEQLGYRPNAAAQATRSGRFGVVGLLMTTQPLRSTLPSDLLNGVHDALASRGVKLLINRMPGEQLGDESALPAVLGELCCDGFLINYTDHIPEAMSQVIERHRQPSVWINSKHESNCVYPNDFDASYRGTRKLIELGHRSIAFADFSHGKTHVEPHYSVADRRDGYRLALREQGLMPRIVQGDGERVPATERVALARAVLRERNRPTAVLCYGGHDVTAFFVAATALRIRVPRDLSLMAFEDRPMEILGPVISSLLLPEQRLGEAAVEMLLRLIERPNRRVQPMAIDFGFEEGQTIQPPSGGGTRRMQA